MPTSPGLVRVFWAPIRPPYGHRDWSMSAHTPSLLARCVAELIGTFLLLFFGLGAVHAAVLTGAQSGLWQVAVVWGLAVMAAVYVVGGVSGAHINPAITVALGAWGKFPRRDILHRGTG